jgi:ribosomal-protein-serine acetyltransferase
VFLLRLDDDLALALREPHHAPAFTALVDAEREHLARAFAWAARADAAAIRRWTLAGLAQFRRGDGWHATLLEGGRSVGAIGLHRIDRLRGESEIGYWLAAGARGRGLMTRALRGVLGYLFAGLGLHKATLRIGASNTASIAVAERLGFRLEARLRHAHVAADGRAQDALVYGLLRGEALQAGSAAGPAADGHAPAPPRFALDAGDGVRVALLEPADAEALAALVGRNAARLDRWFPWVEGTSTATTRGFIDSALAVLADGGGFEAGLYVGGVLAGAMGVHGVEGGGRSGQIGYWVAAEHEGRGVVARGVRAVIRRQFEDAGFERLEIRAAHDNVRSRAVAERLGFAFEGIVRRDGWTGRAAVDQAVYGLLRGERPLRDARGGSAQHSA